VHVLSQKNGLLGGNGIPQFKQQMAAAAGIVLFFFGLKPLLKPGVLVFLPAIIPSPFYNKSTVITDLLYVYSM
jgi:hypothetical protein